ncbi:MAG TPA: acetate--CoA ligase [Gaiellales bacterium]|nr:acetate--CoA ligase [Gaiellales bacterium]
MSDESIDVLLSEGRTFPPPDAFRERAVVKDGSLHEAAERDLDGFWLGQTRELVGWIREPTTGLEWDPPHCTWFRDGTLNASHSCLDRHVEAGRGDQVAYHFVPEDPAEEHRAITYRELLAHVSHTANALRALGIGKGDVVGIYMGMVPELPVAMLACARIGAPHVVVFGGFSASSLGERLESTGAKLLITQDEAWRKGAAIPLKAIADDAVKLAPTVERILVLQRTGADVEMQEGRDEWWHDLVPKQAPHCEPEPVDAEHTLFCLHTSGTTAKPKAAVHTTGGYLTYASATHRWVFDIQDGDIWWCAADVGWVTGHSYIVYGPLNNGTTSVLYEGDPMFPTPARHWEIIERYKVTQYYTAPTLIRAFIKAGSEHPEAHDLSSLRLLGTVGEPINPEAWVWYWKEIGGGRCPVVDTWWQTETGGLMIAPLPGVTTLKPGSATTPLPGIKAEVVDDNGQPVPQGRGGYLVLRRPWPGMFRTLYADDARYVDNYFSRFSPETYFAGDGARVDDDGFFWLMGRIDDVMNVSGHRLSTTELESALVEHPAVAEAAATAAPDALTGQTPLCFVLLRSGFEPSDELAAELREWIGQKIGKIARPKAVIIVSDLPKTRSGKIMRRLLRDIAEGHQLGDTTTLRDPAVVEEIKEKADEVLAANR